MPPKKTIAERYELESKIGSGGMGTVWKAHDRLLDRTVAVKLLHDGLAEDADFAERFRREARAAASLGHPNVVAIYDTGDTGAPFIVMEYVQGESLHQMLHRTGPLPVEDAARIGRSVLAALGHAHSRGLIHRDMKPANVLFDESHGLLKVVDFGIAKSLEDTGGLTRTSGLIGTAAYLSPEQVNGNSAGPASDVYAVGCLLYCCLVGEAPFSAGSPVAIAMKHLNDAVPSLRARRPDVPADLEAVILRALEKDQARRFSSAEAMDRAIAATGLDQRPSSSPAPVAAATLPATRALREHPVGGTVGVGTEVLTRNNGLATTGYRWLLALTAFLVVAAVASVLVLWLQNRDPGDVLAPLPTLEPSAPVAAPSARPSPTPKPTPTESPDKQTPVIQLPGIDVGRPDEPEPTQTPSPSVEVTPDD